MRPIARQTSLTRSLLMGIAMVLALAACGLHEDLEFGEPDDVMPGPGLFTGKSGEWRLLGDEADEAPAAEGAPEGEPDRPLKVRRRR